LVEDKRDLVRTSGDEARAADPEECGTESAVTFVSRIFAQSIGFNAAELTKLASFQSR
jgi:hypothetical protein